MKTLDKYLAVFKVFRDVYILVAYHDCLPAVEKMFAAQRNLSPGNAGRPQSHRILRHVISLISTYSRETYPLAVIMKKRCYAFLWNGELEYSISRQVMRLNLPVDHRQFKPIVSKSLMFDRVYRIHEYGHHHDTD